MTIGERIKELRKQKKFKQKDIAEILQVTRASYSKIESGKMELTLKNLKKIAEIFNVSLDFIVYGKESTGNPSPITDTDTGTGKDYVDLESFGEYSATIRLIIDEMRKDDSFLMHISRELTLFWKPNIDGKTKGA